mmetsp:Transcript_58878/g.116649  ORF Transcript_58878/g.116649 Transcript_58878/m.116649 type:complete len:394 (+) Transcript_58878:171-1352(+)
MESLGSCAAWRQPLPRRLMAAALLVSAAAEAPLLQRPAEARAAAPTGAAQQLPRAAMTSIAPSRRAMELHQQSSDANGACDVDCLVHGQHAICAFRVMWALNHRFKNKPCSAALDMVKAQCPVCLSCTLETLTAKGACSAGALPSTTTLPPAVPVPTPAETAVPAPVPDRYDCMKELFNWQKVWDDAKKQWCCTHRSRGCAADTTASPGRAYSCEIGRGGAANSVQVWSKNQTAWCCKHKGVACPHTTPPSRAASAAVSGKPLPETAHNAVPYTQQQVQQADRPKHSVVRRTRGQAVKELFLGLLTGPVAMLLASFGGSFLSLLLARKCRQFASERQVRSPAMNHVPGTGGNPQGLGYAAMEEVPLRTLPHAREIHVPAMSRDGLTGEQTLMG